MRGVMDKTNNKIVKMRGVMDETNREMFPFYSYQCIHVTTVLYRLVSRKGKGCNVRSLAR